MSIDVRPNMDVAILAGRVPYHERLYVIGPFAERVSFASQQRRALSLVHAIHDDLVRAGDALGLQGKRVCIVGAGLAGLTCSVALAAFKADNWILEKAHHPLDAMRNAKHRDIHPSINFWPREEVTATTELPFLNWYQDRCDLLIQRLFQKWEAFEGEQAEIKGITPYCTVTKLHRSGEGWRIEYTGTDPPVKEFDLVVLATGFGVETVLPNSETPAYWNATMDRVDRIREESQPIVDHYVISGTGDGGLIEILRLLYKRFQAGKVVPETASMLENEAIQRHLRKIEMAARRRASDDVLHRCFPLDAGIRNEIAKLLWDGYQEVYELLPNRFHQRLKAQRTHIPKTILLGQYCVPTEYISAPYHSLLLIHAIRLGWVDYHQVKGAISVSACPRPDEDYQLAASLNVRRHSVSFTSARRITGSGGSFAIQEGDQRIDLECCFYLGRHGTSSPLEQLLASAPSQTVENIRKRQSLYADQDWLTMDQATVLAEGVGLDPPSDKAKWMRAQCDEAKQFFLKFYGLHVADRFPTPDACEFVLRTRDANDGRWVNESDRGELPKRFFGVPVDTSEITVISRGGASGF